VLLADTIRSEARLVGGTRSDYDELLELASDAQLVLLGEASHGSHELYRERSRITQRLILELGFDAVVVEADWPDAERVNRFVGQRGTDADAAQALSGFRRFPSWMWRNTLVREFVEWLRGRGAAFYGMDLYSLYSSIEAVLRYLDRHDPQAAAEARARYACFETGPRESETARRGRSCEAQAVRQLCEIQARGLGSLDAELFSAEQNARLVRNAEAYYRAMFGSRIGAWNLRDRHMFETLEAVAAWLRRARGSARIVVWAHNSHLGDARATEMGQRGELNLGQLVREHYGSSALLVGFTTYEGTVTAVHEWGDEPVRMRVQPALPGSIEALLHEVGLPRFFLPLRDPGEALGALREPLLTRAIGVVYRPHTERESHYFETRVAAQFDVLVHVDRTRAVEPLDRHQQWTAEAPETYPSAL
jgi:erythromycin esterase-like protein